MSLKRQRLFHFILLLLLSLICHHHQAAHDNESPAPEINKEGRRKAPRIPSLLRSCFPAFLMKKAFFLVTKEQEPETEAPK